MGTDGACGLVSFGGKILAITICARRQLNHIKRLLSGLYNLLKDTFHSKESPPGDPRAAHCSSFSVRILPQISLFFPVDRNQRQGPTGA
jgi:hypothetical protein